MLIVILNADYEGFLRDLYAGDPTLARAPYEVQLAARNGTLFGIADFYSKHLRGFGHEAIDLHVNNAHLQHAWAREHGLSNVSVGLVDRLSDAVETASSGRLRGALRQALGLSTSRSWFLQVLAAQLEQIQPDVLVNQAMDWLPPEFICTVRDNIGFLVGQIAAAIPSKLDLMPYDLLLSSLPNYVSRFKAADKPAEIHRLGFEAGVLDRVPPRTPDIAVSFVGSFSPVHQRRLSLIERLCRDTPLLVWGELDRSLPSSSPIRERYQGPAWGVEMYELLNRSLITVNNHEHRVAGPYANNMRLFEATGMGTTLVTDDAINLGDMFQRGGEVATYKDAKECVHVIEELLGDHQGRTELAAAGQRRTLAEHTYAHRAAELIEIIERHCSTG